MKKVLPVQFRIWMKVRGNYLIDKNMKSFFSLRAATIFSSVLLVLTNSCTISDSLTPPSTGTRIYITGDNGTMVTKTTLSGVQTSWVANSDKIGVYSTEAITTSEGTDPVVNALFTASTSGTSSDFTGTMYWGTADTHRFYSYYPYTSGTAARTVVPISLPAAQTQSAGNNSGHIGALDFLVATPVTQAKSTGAANITFLFNHVFTILEFQIIRSSGTGDISEITITGPNKLAFSTAGSIDITQPTPGTGSAYTISYPTSVPTGISNEVTVTLTNAVTPTSNYSTTPKIYAVVLPKTGDGYINIAIKSGSTYKYVQKAAPSGGFDRNKKYIVQIDAASATDYPGSTATPVTVVSATWAPVNCGYDPNHVYGLLYQWNRKYGQVYNEASPAYTLVSGPVTETTGNDAANCNIFYTTSSSSTNWSSSTIPTNWNLTTNNPCPKGWRVPTDNEMVALMALTKTVGNIGVGNGTTFSSGSLQVFMPYFGERNYAGSSYPWPYQHGDYWTGLKKTGAKSHCFDIYANSAVQVPNEDASVTDRTEDDPCVYGLSIRCVKM